MPTRLLYEKICDSATLAELTGDEERLFHRLVVKADDYGRFHAHPSLLLGHCFPLLIEKIGTEKVREWRDRLVDVGLVSLYTVEGRDYLQIVTWADYQRQRGSKPKFPAPLEGAESRGDLPQASAECGSRVVKDTLAGGRRPEAGSREPEAGTSPQPPPQAEGERPPTPRKRGARKPRGERANGVGHDDQEAKPLQEPRLTPVDDRDCQVWNLARPGLAALGLSPSNLEQIDQLVPIGRASDGGLHLRAPPGSGLRRYRNHVVRALLDAGDAAAAQVAIVEG